MTLPPFVSEEAVVPPNEAEKISFIENSIKEMISIIPIEQSEKYCTQEEKDNPLCVFNNCKNPEPEPKKP